MEQKDYLMREIKKLSQFLINLISKISGLNSNNFEAEIKKINDNLITQFDFSLNTLISINNSEFIEKIKIIDNTNLELLIEFLLKITKKISKLEKNKEYDINELVKKAIILIEYIDDKSQIFSIDRMNLKIKLKEVLNEE